MVEQAWKFVKTLVADKPAVIGKLLTEDDKCAAKIPHSYLPMLSDLLRLSAHSHRRGAYAMDDGKIVNLLFRELPHLEPTNCRHVPSPCTGYH